MNYCSCDVNSPLLNDVEALLKKEWPGFSLSREEDSASSLPSPLAAFDGKRLVGALAFALHSDPQGAGGALWVNALYVEPDRRGGGVASRLIERAAAEAAAGGWEKIYAYTDAAGLYESLGWLPEDAVCEPGHRVMSVALLGPGT